MNIEIHKKDVAHIANKVKEGGGNFSDLEIALAKKCLKLYDRIAEINAMQTEYFNALYSIRCTVDAHAGEHLKEKRIKDLEGTSKAAFAKALELNRELEKEKGNGTEQES